MGFFKYLVSYTDFHSSKLSNFRRGIPLAIYSGSRKPVKVSLSGKYHNRGYL